MVSSPNYDRLKVLMNLNAKPLQSGDFQEDSRTGNAHTEVNQVKDTSQAFVNDQSVGQSQTKEGADGWMSNFIDNSNQHMKTIESSKAHHLTLREAMNGRVSEASGLSDTLLTEYERSLGTAKEVRIPTGDGAAVAHVDGATYVAELERQRNEKREAKAKEILDKLNDEARSETDSFSHFKEDYVPEAWKPQPTTDPGLGGGGGGGYRRAPGVGGGGGVLSVGSATGSPSTVSEWQAPAAGEPGSLSNPITDPKHLSGIDLTTTPIDQRLTPNGPVGGHMPADVLNANDPAWRATPSVGGGAARIAGGTLVAGTAAGVGGVAAARGGGGFSGIGGLATGSGGSALRSVAPAGGVLRPSSMPGGAAGAAGRGGIGGAGMRSGMAPVGSGGTGTSAAGSRGGVGAAGRGGVGAAGRSGLVGTGGNSGARGGAAGARGASGVGGRGAAGVAGRGGASGVGGRGAAGVAGRGGVSGVVGRDGAAGSARGGASGAGGRGGAGTARGAAGNARGGSGGRGGLVGAGSSAGRGDKKKETQRRNYDVVRVDGIEEQSSGNIGGGAGSADQLKPLSRDSGEDW